MFTAGWMDMRMARWVEITKLAVNSCAEKLEQCRSINHDVANWLSSFRGVDKRVTELMLMQARELQPCRSCHRDRHFQRKRG